MESVTNFLPKKPYFDDRGNRYEQKGHIWIDKVFSKFLIHYKKKKPEPPVYEKVRQAWLTAFGELKVDLALFAAEECIKHNLTMPTAGQFRIHLEHAKKIFEERERNRGKVGRMYVDVLINRGSEICSLIKKIDPELDWDEVRTLFKSHKINQCNVNPQLSDADQLNAIKSDLLGELKKKQAIGISN